MAEACYLDEAYIGCCEYKRKRRSVVEVHARGDMGNAVPADPSTACKRGSEEQGHHCIADSEALRCRLGAEARHDTCAFDPHGRLAQLIHGHHDVAEVEAIR